MPCWHVARITPPFDEDFSLAGVEPLSHDQRITPTATGPDREEDGLAAGQMLRKTMTKLSLVAVEFG